MSRNQYAYLPSIVRYQFVVYVRSVSSRLLTWQNYLLKITVISDCLVSLITVNQSDIPQTIL